MNSSTLWAGPEGARCRFQLESLFLIVVPVCVARSVFATLGPRHVNDMEEHHDIGPRCYVLNVDIPGLEGKIWVRADYIRIFEFAEKFYAESSSNPKPPCLVITGQPGIGEFC